MQKQIPFGHDNQKGQGQKREADSSAALRNDNQEGGCGMTTKEAGELNC
jgi:hypothetical protein